MIDDETLQELTAWLRSGGGSDLTTDWIPPDHPARLWPGDPSNDGSDALDDLVGILANGGHLPLLAAVVMGVRARVTAPLPSGVERALANALRDWDLARHRSSQAIRRTPDVFLCYAHEDGVRIQSIIRILEQAALSVFRDTNSIAPGESIAGSVVAAAVECSAAVVIVSSASAASTWVRRELSILLAQRVARDCLVLPIVIDDVPLPDSVRDLYCIDLRGLTTLTGLDTVREKLRPVIDRIRKDSDGAGNVFQP